MCSEFEFYTKLPIPAFSLSIVHETVGTVQSCNNKFYIVEQVATWLGRSMHHHALVTILPVPQPLQNSIQNSELSLFLFATFMKIKLIFRV